MSAFLGPIHYWLYNKIQLMESIEKGIIAKIDTDEAKALSVEAQDAVAAFLPEAPLDQLIDTGNIHGWLQDKITKAETRQALFIKKLVEANGEAVYKAVDEVYASFGKISAKDAGIENSNDLSDIFNKLNNYLLEGMPCDRVNQVVENDENTFAWLTAQCVHTGNWSAAEVPVERYYEFRASFIGGFVNGVNESLKYEYTNDGQQKHVISKER